MARSLLMVKRSDNAQLNIQRHTEAFDFYKYIFELLMDLIKNNFIVYDVEDTSEFPLRKRKTTWTVKEAIEDEDFQLEGVKLNSIIFEVFKGRQFSYANTIYPELSFGPILNYVCSHVARLLKMKNESLNFPTHRTSTKHQVLVELTRIFTIFIIYEHPNQKNSCSSRSAKIDLTEVLVNYLEMFNSIVGRYDLYRYFETLRILFKDSSFIYFLKFDSCIVRKPLRNIFIKLLITEKCLSQSNMESVIALIKYCTFHKGKEKIILGFEMFKEFHTYIGKQLMVFSDKNIDINGVDSLMDKISKKDLKLVDCSTWEFLQMGNQFIQYIISMLIKRRYSNVSIFKEVFRFNARERQLFIKPFIKFIIARPEDCENILDIFEKNFDHMEGMVNSFKKQTIRRLVEENNNLISSEKRSKPISTWTRSKILAVIAVFCTRREFNSFKRKFE